jgi:outer membrane protein TolC
MVNEGYAKKVYLLEVQAKKANVVRMIEELKSNQRLNLHYLSFLLNQSVTEIIVPNLESMHTTINEGDVLASNLDLQKASRGLEIRSAMINVANAPFYPQIGAFTEASSADNTFLGDFGAHKAYTVGARLSWNLFNGGIDDHLVQKARIEQLKSKTEIQLAQKGVSLQYDQIRTEIQNNDFQIQSLTKELELSEAIYRNYEGRYREHLVSMNDVLIKHSQQIEKILALNTIKNQRNERIFALEKLTFGAQK